MADEEWRIVGGNRRPIQKVPVKPNEWTKTRRETFLKVLADTCNVSMATRAADTSKSPYVLRRSDPAFALLWDEALAIGYDRLEMALLQRALEGVNAIDLDALLADIDAPADEGAEGAAADGEAADTPPSPPPRRGPPKPGQQGLTSAGLVRSDVQLALDLLKRRRDGDGEVRQRQKRKLMTSEEVDTLLLKKLDSLARKLKPTT